MSDFLDLFIDFFSMNEDEHLVKNNSQVIMNELQNSFGIDMLREKIFGDIKQAMKDKEVEKLAALRFVWARIKELEIDKKAELDDKEVETLLRKEIKSRKEAIEQFRQAGRDDLVTEEEGKLKFLEVLLPKLMSEDGVRKVVEKIVGDTNANFGQVMGQAMGKLKGKADGLVVSKVVKEILGL